MVQLVSELIEANGKTVRENNLQLEHDIPIGTLVEIDCPTHDEHGLRLFVVEHTRDCDGSPMYNLSFNKNVVNELSELNASKDSYAVNSYLRIHNYLLGQIIGGWGKESLHVISKE